MTHHFYLNPSTAQGPLVPRVRQFIGGSWQFPATPPTNNVAVSGQLGTANAYIEWSISRADLGLTGAATLQLTGSLYDASNAATNARFPTELVGGVYPQRYLSADMGAARDPNFAGYILP